MIIQNEKAVEVRQMIDVGFAYLVADKYCCADSGAPFDEVCIYLEDKFTGLIIQDIAMVRQAHNPESGEITPDALECLIWSNCNVEDYTHKFTIARYIEEE